MDNEEEKKEEKKHEGGSQSQGQNKYFWIVGAVILLLVGWFAWKVIFGAADYKVTLVNVPKEVTEGGNITFTWRVDGPPTTINHTSVYFGQTSNPGVLGADVKPADTKYTDWVKDFDNGNYGIPLQFVGNSPVGAPGTYFFRVNALINGKNYWSDENTFTVKSAGDYKVSVLNAAKSLVKDQTITFTWRIDGKPTTITHTAVYFGPESTPGTLAKDVTPDNTKYTNMLKDFNSGTYNVPLQFVGSEKIATAGAYFFRAQAFINGQNYWSNEGTFEVK